MNYQSFNNYSDFAHFMIAAYESRKFENLRPYIAMLCKGMGYLDKNEKSNVRRALSKINAAMALSYYLFTTRFDKKPLDNEDIQVGGINAYLAFLGSDMMGINDMQRVIEFMGRDFHIIGEKLIVTISTKSELDLFYAIVDNSLNKLKKIGMEKKANMTLDILKQNGL